MQLTQDEGQLLAQLIVSVRQHSKAELTNLATLPTMHKERIVWLTAVIDLCDKVFQAYQHGEKVLRN